MSQFEVAGLRMDFETDHFYIRDRLERFASDFQDKPHISIYINNKENIRKPCGETMLSDSIQWIKKLDGTQGYYIYISNMEDEVVGMLDIDKNWSSASLSYLGCAEGQRYTPVGPLSEILFRTCILFHRGIVIHASAIECEGKGIMFSAPSETGKSTQANLWKIHKKAKVLNGDRPLVRIKEDKAFVFGTPWSGSSPDYINSSAPLSAIVMLEQAPENSIRELNVHEAITRLMPRSFLPYFDKELMDMAVDNLEAVIETTPVYLLKCRPDKEAVELVYACIK